MSIDDREKKNQHAWFELLGQVFEQNTIAAIRGAGWTLACEPCIELDYYEGGLDAIFIDRFGREVRRVNSNHCSCDDFDWKELAPDETEAQFVMREYFGEVSR